MQAECSCQLAGCRLLALLCCSMGFHEADARAKRDRVESVSHGMEGESQPASPRTLVTELIKMSEGTLGLDPVGKVAITAEAQENAQETRVSLGLACHNQKENAHGMESP